MDEIIEVGDIVEDNITGFTGAVRVISRWKDNCPRAGVQSRELKDGKPIDMVWFDVPQLNIIKKGETKVIPPPAVMFKLGDIVKDRLTPYQGTMFGYAIWDNGCIRIGIQANTLHEGKPVDDIWLPQNQLELVVPNPVKEESQKRTGGPMNDPRPMRDAR